jgi:hypothetical protein
VDYTPSQARAFKTINNNLQIIACALLSKCVLNTGSDRGFFHDCSSEASRLQTTKRKCEPEAAEWQVGLDQMLLTQV